MTAASKAVEERAAETQPMTYPPAGSQLAFARVATALAFVSVGALALGAMSIGALAVGKLRLKDGRVGRLSIEELEVDRLRVRELITEKQT